MPLKLGPLPGDGVASRDALHDIDQTVFYHFGPFVLDPIRHLLTQAGKPVRIGSRALTILVALVEKNVGELVSKEELIAKAWPNVVVVDEANLRSQMFELRRALGDGKDGMRYIATVPGRGYRFIAPLGPASPRPLISPTREGSGHHVMLAARFASPIGREEAVSRIAQRLLHNRLITITGPGGIGKTTVALAVRERSARDYADGVVLIDLAPVTGASLVDDTVVSAIARMLSRDSSTDETAATSFAEKRILVILDNCEHVVEACAAAAETLCGSGAGIHILATSREPLGAVGEEVFRLQPLATPQEADGLTAENALRFPAIRLFVERARAHVQDFELGDIQARAAVEICRKLDGIPLAIELAAGQVEAFGAEGVAARLDDWFQLAMRGRRTALPRHQTLGDTLDWSFETLSEEERKVLLRLASFAGRFSIEGACAVGGEDTSRLYRIIANLVRKSLIDVDSRDPATKYRLLEATRMYCLQRLLDGVEARQVFSLHARYTVSALEAFDQGGGSEQGSAALANLSQRIGDIRVALERTTQAGDTDLFVALVLASLPLWMHMASYRECRTHVEAALVLLRQAQSPSAKQEMRLLLALGTALAYLKGAREQTESAFSDALHLAALLDDPERQLQALWGLWSSRFNGGRVADAYQTAQRFRALAGQRCDEGAGTVGERLLAASCFALGDFRGTHHHLTTALDHSASWINAAAPDRFRFDQRVAARSLLGITSWILGHPDQAVREAENSVAEADALKHPLSQALALERACSVFILNGSFDRAEATAEALAIHAGRHSLEVWQLLAACCRAAILIGRGQLDNGLRQLGETIAAFPRQEFQVRHIAWQTRWAEALGQAGYYDEALAVIAKLIEEIDARAQSWCHSDLLCVKGHIHQARGELGDIVSAETAYRTAISRASEQHALSLELRAALGLAKLWRSRGRMNDARELLSPIYGRFTEGFDTLDLTTARQFISPQIT